ncbi:hypothetical protein [Streptomyces sp. Ac-502]|uniref:hypothetical protein n=1 Tax=Streptomyces sp. Ac-502 TaxID=3342801 RepID=UPI003862485A
MLPFDAYEMSNTENLIIESAEDVLLRDCMQRQKLPFTLLSPPDQNEADAPNRHRYGLIEPAIADRFGYHRPPQDPATAQRDADWDARLKRMTPRERYAAYGKDGDGGCSRAANAELLQAVPRSGHSEYNVRITEVFDRSERAPEVKQAVRAWSACMRQHGFPYTAPLTRPATAVGPRPTAPLRTNGTWPVWTYAAKITPGSCTSGKTSKAGFRDKSSPPMPPTSARSQPPTKPG